MAYWIGFWILVSIFSYPLAALVVAWQNDGEAEIEEEKEIEEAIAEESDDNVDYSWLENLENEES